MPRYMELEISLRDIEPRIWRRILIRSTANCNDLHEAIRDACGWAGYHLWEFREAGRKGRSIAGAAELEDGPLGSVPGAPQVKLDKVFTRKGARCAYIYDFGDYWEHEVKLRDTLDLPERFTRRLLAGRRAFPPEDCGGTPGYHTLMAALGRTGSLPDHFDPPGEEELAGIRKWIGEDWDPEAFDLEAARADFDA